MHNTRTPQNRSSLPKSYRRLQPKKNDIKDHIKQIKYLAKNNERLIAEAIGADEIAQLALASPAALEKILDAIAKPTASQSAHTACIFIIHGRC